MLVIRDRSWPSTRPNMRSEKNSSTFLRHQSPQLHLLRLKTCLVISLGAQRLARLVLARSFWLPGWLSHTMLPDCMTHTHRCVLRASTLSCRQQSGQKFFNSLAREADLARWASTSSLSVYSLPTFPTKIDDLLKSWPCSLRRFGCYRYQARQSSSDLQPIYRHKFRAALLPMAESC